MLIEDALLAARATVKGQLSGRERVQGMVYLKVAMALATGSQLITAPAALSRHARAGGGQMQLQR